MIRLPLVLTIALALPAAAQARDYGQQGAVFPVIERDLLEQIHSRLVAMEKSGETAKLNDQLKRRTAARVNRGRSSPEYRRAFCRRPAIRATP